ncbi:TerB family tellurite resistance protein [Vibrio splendidus]|jgi:uncharacterized tellurite resistance protein B-like protein|uniref:tellurite resistance TerB family protein n=1 Tax=Vibrio splendidus TaxID=29497 RepID=UPI00352C544C
MLDILDVINEATKEANSFENHAAKDLTLEECLLYLQGLALVMNADGEIHAEEKEYIRILIKSFEMDESILESFVEFAKRPDKDTVQAFFRTFRRRPIAQLFLFDALMMTRRDDSVDEREKAVIDKIAEQLEVRKGTYSDIFDLFCHIKNKDWDESALYFSSYLLNPEHFKHLLDYFEVNLEELLARTKNLQSKRIKQIITSKLNLGSYEWENLKYYCDSIETDSDTKITSHYIDLKNVMQSLDELIVLRVQSDLDRESITVNPIGDIEDNTGYVLANVESLGLRFDKEKKAFSLNVSNDEVEKEEQTYAMARYLSTGDISSSHSINKVISFLFQDETVRMATARRHPSYSDERCFPKSDNKYLSEIVEFEGKLYESPGGSTAYVPSVSFNEYDGSYMTAIQSSRIRVIKN